MGSVPESQDSDTAGKDEDGDVASLMGRSSAGWYCGPTKGKKGSEGEVGGPGGEGINGRDEGGLESTETAAGGVARGRLRR